jgi:hypothetical protein
MEENTNVVNASAVSDEEIAKNYEKTVNSSIQEAEDLEKNSIKAGLRNLVANLMNTKRFEPRMTEGDYDVICSNIAGIIILHPEESPYKDLVDKSYRAGYFEAMRDILRSVGFSEDSLNRVIINNIPTED